MDRHQRTLFIIGNVCAQVYLVLVAVTALLWGNGWALGCVIMAEGTAAMSYQLQLLFDMDIGVPPITKGMVTIALTVLSWFTAFAAGVLLLI